VAKPESTKAWHDDQWNAILTQGPQIRGVRRMFRVVPSSPRCGLCLAPFSGLGGRVFRLAGFAPSRKNPRYCGECFERAPHGGAEVVAGILFADVRGFTTYSESRPPETSARLLNRFYRAATDVLAARGAIIDKLIGDEVMAIFVPGLAGPTYVQQMAQAAEELLRSAGYGGSGGSGEPWLPLGIGLDRGLAFVGNVGAGEVKDFTAIGDVVNTASRLQAEAAAGEIVMSDAVHAASDRHYAGERPINLVLRGKTDPVDAWVVNLGSG
jgi:adenylate cyclase